MAAQTEDGRQLQFARMEAMADKDLVDACRIVDLTTTLVAIGGIYSRESVELAAERLRLLAARGGNDEDAAATLAIVAALLCVAGVQ